MIRLRTLAVLAVAVVAFSRVPAPSAGHDDKEAMPSLYKADTLKWKDGPPSLPPGAQIAVLEGDPAKPGPFVFRVKVPDGYKIPPPHAPQERAGDGYFGDVQLGHG